MRASSPDAHAQACQREASLHGTLQPRDTPQQAYTIFLTTSVHLLLGIDSQAVGPQGSLATVLAMGAPCSLAPYECPAPLHCSGRHPSTRRHRSHRGDEQCGARTHLASTRVERPTSSPAPCTAGAKPCCSSAPLTSHPTWHREPNVLKGDERLHMPCDCGGTAIESGRRRPPNAALLSQQTARHPAALLAADALDGHLEEHHRSLPTALHRRRNCAQLRPLFHRRRQLASRGADEVLEAVAEVACTVPLSARRLRWLMPRRRRSPCQAAKGVRMQRMGRVCP